MRSRAMLILTGVTFIAIIFSTGIRTQSAAQQETDKKKAGDKKDGGVRNEFVDVEVTGGRVRDFKPYVQAIKDLEKMNKEYSENLLRLSIDEYSTGLGILEDMDNEVIKLKSAYKKKKYLNERFYWQEIDRKNAGLRQGSAKKLEAKMKAWTNF